MPDDLPELLRAADLGAMLGMSRSSIFELRRSGSIPEPLTIGGGTFFRRAEIIDWLNAGAPPINRWDWQPATVVRLSRLVELLSREATELQQELNRLRAALAAGETTALVRRG